VIFLPSVLIAEVRDRRRPFLVLATPRHAGFWRWLRVPLNVVVFSPNTSSSSEIRTHDHQYHSNNTPPRCSVDTRFGTLLVNCRWSSRPSEPRGLLRLLIFPMVAQVSSGLNRDSWRLIKQLIYSGDPRSSMRRCGSDFGSPTMRRSRAEYTIRESRSWKSNRGKPMPRG
jgi:hypothetical protein